MVSAESVHKQLKKLGFKHNGWGMGEVKELPNIILPDEEIFEVVNGIYEGGFALLLATDVRVVLVDKKPLNYLTVEDIRFDMINEMDYSHRLLGAQISIATGNKNLVFRSYNQQRLRKLIGHVQHSMADSKKKQNNHQEDQKEHLQQINQQLQAYLVAQHQYQQQMQYAQHTGQPAPPVPEPAKPSPELSDYLFAQSLLAQYQSQAGPAAANLPVQSDLMAQIAPQIQQPAPPLAPSQGSQFEDLYAEGMQEIFGKREQTQAAPAAIQAAQTTQPPKPLHHHALDVNPMRVAYSKLPMALRNRRFGRPSFHAHSQQDETLPKPEAQPFY